MSQLKSVPSSKLRYKRDGSGRLSAAFLTLNLSPMALAGPSRSVPTTATSIPKDELLFIPHTHHDGTPRLEDQANRNDGSSRLVEALVLDGGLEEEDLVDGTFKEPELVTDLSSEEEIHEVFLDALAQVTDAMQEMGREAEPLCVLVFILHT